MSSSRNPFQEPSEWLGRLRLLDDAPIANTERDDLLGFGPHVEMIASALVHAQGPMVVHIDGPWGRGKSSFCRLLEAEFSAHVTKLTPVRAVTPSWFIASDRCADMVDGVLHAIARAVTQDDPEETLRILKTWGQRHRDVLGTGEDLARMSQFNQWVEQELGWTDRGDQQAEVIVALGDGEPLQLSPRAIDRRLAVIFIDDLDRCTPQNARAVMDAVQQFVSCPGIAFVIAADRAVLEVAFQASVEDYIGVARLGTAQALEKYIRHCVQLPGIHALARSSSVNQKLYELQERILPGRSKLLHGPGAWLQSGVAVALVRSFPVTMTVRRLKRILNDLAAVLAKAADNCRLSSEDVDNNLWQRKPTNRYQPWLDLREPSDLSEYEDYFLGRLAIVTTKHVWPTLYNVFLHNTELYANLISSLTGLGVGIRKWPESMLLRVINELVEETKHDQTPAETKKELCVFLGHIYQGVAVPRGIRTALEDEVLIVEDVVSRRGKRSSSRGVENVVRVRQALVHVGKEVQQTRSAETEKIFIGDPAEHPDAELEQRTNAAVAGLESPTSQTEHFSESTAPKQGLTTEAPAEHTDNKLEQRTDAEDPAPRLRTPEQLTERLENGIIRVLESKLLRFESVKSLSIIDLRAYLDDLLEYLHARPSKPWLHKHRKSLFTTISNSQWTREADEFVHRINLVAWELADHGLDFFPIVFKKIAPGHLKEKFLWAYPFLRWVLKNGVADPLMRFLEVLEVVQEDATVLDMPVLTLRVLRLTAESRLDSPTKWLQPAISLAIKQDFSLELVGEIMLGCRVLKIPVPSNLLQRILNTIEDAGDEQDSTTTYPWYQLDSLSVNRARRLYADTLFDQRGENLRVPARIAYLKLRGTSEWTPSVLHHLAQIYYQTGSRDRAGHFWELGYRKGMRTPELRRSFAHLLHETHPDDATAVQESLDLPDDRQLFEGPVKIEEIHDEPEATT